MTAEKRKLLILAVLDMLKRHTDSEHRLRQAELLDLLAKNYRTAVTRKTLRQNLGDLQFAGYPVRFAKGWYYDHEFTAEDVDRIISALMQTKDLTEEVRGGLIGKVRRLHGEWFVPEASVRASEEGADPELIRTLDVLHQAMRQGVQVSFRYADYGTDKKLHPRRGPDGQILVCHVSPHHMAEANGRYYLIGSMADRAGLQRFRADRIVRVRMLRRAARPLKGVAEVQACSALPGESPAGPAGASGRAVRHRIRISRAMISDLLDWFGMDVSFTGERGDSVEALIHCDDGTLGRWMDRFGAGTAVIR